RMDRARAGNRGCRRAAWRLLSCLARKPQGPGGGALLRMKAAPVAGWSGTSIATRITSPAIREGNGGSCLEPIVKTENLWKGYRTGKVDVPALRGVDIEILPGEFVSIMGPSGCGKSTMLHVIGGLAQATRGKVLLDGNDLTAMTDAERTML